MREEEGKKKEPEIQLKSSEMLVAENMLKMLGIDDDDDSKV